MKKIFTLLFSVGLVGSVFAQSGRQDRFRVSNDVVYNKAPEALMNSHTSMYDNNFFNADRDHKIREINREYDRQIMQVKFNRHLRPFEKDRMITMLEMQRDQKIREMSEHSMFKGRRDGFDHKW